MALTRPTVTILAVLAMLSGSFPLDAVEPTPIDKALAIQTAMAEARDHLTANLAAEAITVLEAQLPYADGNRAFLDLLRSAYVARIKKLQVTVGDPMEVANIRTKLKLLGLTAIPGEPEPDPVAPAVPASPDTPVSPAPGFTPPVATLQPAQPASAQPRPQPQLSAQPPSQTAELLSQAASLFNEAKAEPAKFELAARMFAAAFGQRVEMRKDQLAAWEYCRLRLAADHLNQAGLSAESANGIVMEIEDALKIAPDNAALQKVGQELLAIARQRAGTAAPTAQPSASSSPDGWEVVESESFLVRHRGDKTIAEAIAKAAEVKRNEIFSRWSGPAGGAWSPKCTITLHKTAANFAAETQQHPSATGRAMVHLSAGRVSQRRMALRADDPTVLEDALPRELSHIVLADLFPTKAPPRWAIEGMAVLATSAVEVDRYLRTLPRCRESGEWIPLETLLTLPVPPADKVTGYYVGSVSLVEFLVRWKGDKAFTTFLRDSHRYGLESAMKRQYGVADAKQLEATWLQAAGSVSTRGGYSPIGGTGPIPADRSRPTVGAAIE
ncbi:MAG: hypothetical protein LC104_12065 [Bacteroidales bacterium]|nr:hypothetical protein [Bacteroidales bacterium]